MDDRKKKKRNHNQETSDGDRVARSSSSVSDEKKKIDKEPKIKTPILFESKPSSSNKKKKKKKKKEHGDQIIVQGDPVAEIFILNKKKKKRNDKEPKKLVAKRTSIQAENDSSSEPSFEKEFNFRDYYWSEIDDDEDYDPMADCNLPGSESPVFIEKTIVVKGLDISLGVNDLRAVLQNHFSQCGKIMCITIPPADKRFAYITFCDFEACKKALGLNQSKVGDMRLTVETGEGIWEPETTSTSKTFGSKTIRVGNLNSKILEADMQEISKSAGKKVKVTFEGYAHVEVESAKAARKALKVNMKELAHQG